MSWANWVKPGGARRFSGRRQPSYDDTSRMMREYQVRICEGLGVKFPGPTRQTLPTRAIGHMLPIPPTSAAMLQCRIRRFSAIATWPLKRSLRSSPEDTGDNPRSLLVGLDNRDRLQRNQTMLGMADQRALECHKRAAKAHLRALELPTPSGRERFLEIEKYWLRVARAYENSLQLETCLCVAISKNTGRG